MPSSNSRSLLLVPFITACGGPTVGDIAEQEITLSVSGITSEPETAALGESRGGVGVERAVVRVTSLTLGGCREGSADLELGARSFDLLSEPRPSERVTTAVNELCRIGMRIEPVPGRLEGVPDEASLFVAGVDSRGDAVEWSSPGSLSLSFEAHAGQSFGVQPLLLGFDLAAWLDGVPAPGDGEAPTQLETQLRRAAALYADSDADGELDADTPTPITRAQ